MPEHISLIKQEILRWQLSWIATVIFTLVLMLFVAADYLTMGYIAADVPRLLLALLILLLAILFFRHKKHSAEKILNRLTE
ncbi:hypothetical protein [Lacimicrobium alkaliphilum]|uniref:Uncharacterized protein n=1 Tax=Lacimicrobium alkaliphilum TaxID=1526571 RepID=A0ABQ1RIK4_9ALTE|nr:hypothetical protein [Lacimicrobium alkaliphilum]GGD69496.1 hypothetical protein GCM10011357_25680 [Lacimicrobium alkaliphilum]